MVSKSREKVVHVPFHLPNKIYMQFKNKAYGEGYSIQKALELLTTHYVDGTLLIENDE